MKRDTALRTLANAHRHIWNTGADSWPAAVDAINILDTAADTVERDLDGIEPTNPVTPFDSILIASKRYEL